MICAGLDVGSRTIKFVTFDNGVVDYTVTDTGVNPLKRCREILASLSYENLVVTGYGRQLVAPAVGATMVTEIKAHAVGAKYLYPDCRTVIDVGGQDSKAILMTPEGDIQEFEMNDRCAAGTGKFLETMANALEVDIQGFGELALNATRTVSINSLCTVFAESEVVSLIARGEDGSAIALGLHQAVATRIAAMARRIAPQVEVVFSGGAAQNNCLHQLLSEKLNIELTIPDKPQIIGALGAAIIAQQNGMDNG
jgi:predicted CoA-substrate-specific enzyme activase